MSVVVISSGGTIASTKDARGALVPALSADELVASCGTTRHVRAIDIASLDSSSMGLREVDLLRAVVRDSLSDGDVSCLLYTSPSPRD